MSETTPTLPYSPQKQMAFLGHILLNPEFCIKALRFVQPTWFVNVWCSRIYKAVQTIHQEYNRPPTLPEIRQYKDFVREDAPSQKRTQETMDEALKESLNHRLDILKNELNAWLSATIFQQNIRRAATLYNHQKLDEAWDLVQKG